MEGVQDDFHVYLFLLFTTNTNAPREIHSTEAAFLISLFCLLVSLTLMLLSQQWKNIALLDYFHHLVAHFKGPKLASVLHSHVSLLSRWTLWFLYASTHFLYCNGNGPWSWQHLGAGGWSYTMPQNSPSHLCALLPVHQWHISHLHLKVSTGDRTLSCPESQRMKRKGETMIPCTAAVLVTICSDTHLQNCSLLCQVISNPGGHGCVYLHRLKFLPK